MEGGGGASPSHAMPFGNELGGILAWMGARFSGDDDADDNHPHGH